MKVLIFVNTYLPEVRSASSLYGELAEDLVHGGDQVTVVTGVPRQNLPPQDARRYRGRFLFREWRNGVRVVRLPVVGMPRNVPGLRAIEQFVLAGEYALGALPLSRPDVALVYSPPLPLALSADAVRRARGVPFVMNVQDVYPQAAVDLGLLKSRRLIALAERMERYAYRRAAAIAVHSDGNKALLERHGADGTKVSVLPNWVDTQRIQPAPRANAFRAEHGLGDAFVVSFAGTMGFAQGLDGVLEAAALLRDAPDVRFALVGDGSLRPALVRKAQELRLANVTFLPMQPPERYPGVLAASDACLVTLSADVKTPVVPAKLLDVLASGRPALAVMPEGDAADIVRRSGGGIVVPPGDPLTLAYAVRALANDPARRSALGAAGRAYAVAEVSRPVGVGRFRDLLARVAAHTGRP